MPSINFSVGPNGPIVALGIGVSRARRQMLVASKKPVPQIELAHALIDTGASSTVVDIDTLKALGVPPHGQTKVITPSTGATPAPFLIYDVSVWLAGGNSSDPDDVLERARPVIGAELKHQGFQVLLGRDILSHCLLLYNGKDGNGVLGF